MDNKLLINLIEKINKLQNSVDKLQQEMEKMNLNHTDLSKKCDKMTKHIDFIDNVYEKVRYPLGYVCHKISSVMGNQIERQNILPNIEN